jgi:hypothetical protein
MNELVFKKNLIFSTKMAFFVSCCLVIFGPLSIYFNNQQDFNTELSELFIALSLWALLVFSLLLTLLQSLPARASQLLVRVLAVITLSSWILSSFIYGEYGQLDGKDLEIDPWSWLTLLQFTVLFILFLSALKLKIDLVTKALSFVFFIGLITTGLSLLDLSSKDEQVHTATAGLPPQITTLSPTRNILHVILDTLQTDFLMMAISDDETLAESLEGFTVFTDAASIYPSTAMSLPMLLTGRTYKNEGARRDFAEKIRQDQPGIALLRSRGYELNGLLSKTVGILDYETRPRTAYVSKNSQSTEPLNLLDIFLFKSVPDAIKPMVFSGGDWFFLKHSNHNEHLKLGGAGVGYLLFESFINDLVVTKKPAPRYTLFHSFVTHGPVRMDKNCTVLNVTEAALYDRAMYARCGLSQFTRLLKKLKSLGVYDNTMIILSADHGAGWSSDDHKEAFSSTIIPLDVPGYASAALAIKPFEERGALKESLAPASLLDIPITILAAEGIKELAITDTLYPPRDLLSLPQNEKRTREYLHYSWQHKYWHEDTLPPITSYTIKGSLKKPESWPSTEKFDASIQCNAPLLFSQLESGLSVVSGMSEQEAWGRWSNSNTVRIAFNYPETACKDENITLNLQAYVNKKHKKLRASVLLNDEPIKNFTLVYKDISPTILELDLPAGLLNSGVTNILKFKIDNPASPASLGKGQDSRMLGLGFVSVEFR